MNKISVIINEVRYDAVDCGSEGTACIECELEDFCGGVPIITLCQALDIERDDIHFKKSIKSFEV